ncbi:rhomboid family intramembrane serine protease [Niveibacterium sp. SC-1]|uniref:rhomboid family intramembrane serine protease n=1 Tax=Niveibacterium sp. SC-1 TaxID=3135646 RepID=UPI00311E96FA
MDERRFLRLLFARVSRPWVTMGLLALNTLIFALMVLRGANPLHVEGVRLVAAGALYGPLTLDGQPWRLFTAFFLHGGILHLAFNMFALWQAGGLVERLFGHGRYLGIYLGAGLAGSVMSLWWRPAVLSVGASGAIFGVYGALLGFMLVERAAMPRDLMRELRTSALGFIGFSLFAGFVMTAVDNAAHIGGLLGGLALGAALAHPLDQRFTPGFFLRATMGVVAAGLVAAGLWWQVEGRTAGQREAATQARAELRGLAFADRDLTRRGNQVFQQFLRSEMPPEQAAQTIERELLPAWQSVIMALSATAVRDPALRPWLDYAQARRNALQALARAIATGDEVWLQRALRWQQQADALARAPADVPGKEKDAAQGKGADDAR